MPFCKNCGNQLKDDAVFCDKCGTNAVDGTSGQGTHDVPKCQHCGHVGQWKIAPIIRGVDIFIGILLLILGVVPGIVYFVTVAIIRSNPDRRSKVCTKCGAKNLFTFIY